MYILLVTIVTDPVTLEDSTLALVGSSYDR